MTGFTLLRVVALAAIAVVAVAVTSCGKSGLQGTYTNANGMATLEIKSGGEASLTLMGENQTCTYKQEDAKLVLTCPGGESLEIAVHEDGSLTPVGTFIGTMKKAAS